MDILGEDGCSFPQAFKQVGVVNRVAGIGGRSDPASFTRSAVNFYAAIKYPAAWII